MKLKTDIDSHINSNQDYRTDLTDVTFLVPLRIDSQERKENVNVLIKYIYQHFKTNFIVLEADSIQRFYPEISSEEFKYEFLKDSDAVFHRTRWINQLIKMSKTSYVAIWDADAIAPPEQIIEAVNELRLDNAVLSFPYDGQFFSCDKISCDLFKRLLNIKILIERVSLMQLMHGYYSVGGAFIVNKEKYQQAGGENENFYGWGPEDTERVKRLEIMRLPIFYSPGRLFHLWHPIGANSWFVNSDIEVKNRKALQETCKLTNIKSLLR